MVVYSEKFTAKNHVGTTTVLLGSQQLGSEDDRSVFIRTTDRFQRCDAFLVPV